VIIQDSLAIPHLSYIFNNEPYPTPSDRVLVRSVNKLSNMGPFQLMYSPTYISHYQAALPRSPTRAFNLLPRNPAQTHVFILTAFHFYIYSYHFWRFTLFKPGNSLSLHHSFPCLGSPCHATANAKPTDFNPVPSYCT